MASNEVRAAVWQDRLARYEQCDLTVEEFCAEEGVSSAAFYYWRRKDHSHKGKRSQVRRRATPPAAGLFVPVRVKPAGVTEAITITLPGGAIISIPGHCDVDILRTCIQAAVEFADGEDAAC